MNTQKLEKLLDPKNQNLPKLNLAASTKADILIKPNFKAKKGEVKDEIKANKVVRTIGVGPKKDFDARAIRRFFGASYSAAASKQIKEIAYEVEEDWVKFAAVGIHCAALNPSLFKNKPSGQKPPTVTLINKGFKNATKAKKALKKGQTLAEGKNLMRILGAAPPNLLHPQSYASLVQKLAKKWKIKVTRVPKAKLKKYELLNAVSRGSIHDSELLIFTLHPKSGKTKTSRAIFGKGICFDSGGIISKQDQMKSMKEDMAGSASVLGTVLQVAKGAIELEKTTHFLMPLAENMMGSDATRVDDIWTAGDGQTVEIVHTDAEGRLILGDAICYAKNSFKNADEYYTIATLTGSCMRAFGDAYTGMVVNDKKLQTKVEKDAVESGDYVWAGPWNPEYDEAMNSAVADVGNLSEDPNAGWIKAGMYLHRFVPEKAKFCHFDIAGSVDMYEKGKNWRAKGFNSGVGVSLLSEIIS